MLNKDQTSFGYLYFVDRCVGKLLLFGMYVEVKYVFLKNEVKSTITTLMGYP